MFFRYDQMDQHSEDYGKVVSHVEMLIQIFNSFMQTLTSSDDRIKRVSNFSHKLIQEDNTLLKTFGKFLQGDT